MSSTRDTLPILYIVVPCYNEEEVLPETVSRLTTVLNHLIKERVVSTDSAALLVDDGSKDKTWTLIERYFQSSSMVKGLKLARNAGHQNALFAGLMHAKDYADVVISIDADLQDDISAIEQMVRQYQSGYDVVYGVRNSRATDTFFKRFTAQMFYRLMQRMGADIVYNHADYRLLSNRVLQELALYDERNLFLRGIIPMIGFRSTEIHYDRAKRFAGESKYPLKQMLSFAFDGITSLSVAPIRLVSIVGVLMLGLSLFLGLDLLIHDIFWHAVSGWISLTSLIVLIGGIQLIGLGLVGEYVGKTYKETKQRPKYHVDTVLHTKFDQKTSRSTSRSNDGGWKVTI